MNQLSNQVKTIDSREVAEMIGKQHAHLMRDIKGYVDIIDPNPKLDSADFFTSIRKHLKQKFCPTKYCYDTLYTKAKKEIS